jgi:hypothetical protein
MVGPSSTGGMVRHVGVHNDKRCVIVLQLPEEPRKVHVIDTDSLPDLYHQNLMDIVNSPEGQAAQWLGNVLNYKMLFDGTNALKTLYQKGFITPVSVDNVRMAPKPNMLIPFTTAYPHSAAVQVAEPALNDPLATQQNPGGQRDNMYAGIVAEEQRKLNEGLQERVEAYVPPAPTAESHLHNQHTENLRGDGDNKNQQIANNLLAEAAMLESEAQRKRQQAAKYNPSLATRPQATTPRHEAPVYDTPTYLAEDEEGPFVDPATGKEYKSAGALKGAITKREKAGQS